jgi:alpha-1,2-glucosyltransferase
MLYLWPLFAFFSAPLIIPSAMSSLSSIYKAMAGLVNRTQAPLPQRQARNPTSISPTGSLQVVDFLFSRVFNIFFVLGAAVLSVGIVKYNTIVHPFTLADNRHYMFYVFRYTILRSPTVRFSLVGAYMISAYLVWSRLAGCPPTEGSFRDIHYINRPFDSNSFVTRAKTTPPAPLEKTSAAAAGNEDAVTEPASTTPPAAASPATSTALLWLATTALSLVSAPLVEPRYFILPWIFWRLLVPSWSTPVNPPDRLRALPGVTWLNALGRRVDLTVVLETAWFVVVNLVTFWVFLSRPYQWKGVDGRVLDKGQWQRFMW